MRVTKHGVPHPYMCVGGVTNSSFTGLYGALAIRLSALVIL